MEFDRKDFTEASRRLKFSALLLIFCLIGEVILIILIGIAKGNAHAESVLTFITLFIVLSGMVLHIMVIFRIRFVLQRMRKNATLWQLAMLLIPPGTLIFPWIILGMADEFLIAKSKGNSE